MDVAPTSLLTLLGERGQTLCTAESCTGGLIAAALTDVAGSSNVFIGSIVSYANCAKRDLLAVDATILHTEGAVSRACALAMAQGARHALKTDWSVSTTGIAGPSGGTTDKPIGLVWIAACGQTQQTSVRHLFTGNRAAVREQALAAAITCVYQLIQNEL